MFLPLDQLLSRSKDPFILVSSADLKNYTLKEEEEAVKTAVAAAETAEEEEALKTAVAAAETADEEEEDQPRKKGRPKSLRNNCKSK